eukprot:EST45345.1 Hypothetical protein SS50377_14924 [Spironucleus salmonicida]
MSEHTILEIVQHSSQHVKEQLTISPYGRQLISLADIYQDLEDALLCLQVPPTAPTGEILKLFTRAPPQELDLTKTSTRKSSTVKKLPQIKK